MNIQFLGHASFYLNFGETKLLFDPFISGNPLASHIDISSLTPDYILVSHGHQDHILDVESIARENKATIVSNYEIIQHYQKLDLNGHPINHGGKKTFDFGTVKYVNAIHTSSFPDGSYAGSPGGFVVWNDDKCIYFAGDTALTKDMELIPQTCPKLDVAIFPIGDNFTMGYEDAVIAADMVQCNKIIGCHFNTFGYIKIDVNEAKKAFADRGKELIIMEIGEILSI